MGILTGVSQTAGLGGSAGADVIDSGRVILRTDENAMRTTIRGLLAQAGLFCAPATVLALLALVALTSAAMAESAPDSSDPTDAAQSAPVVPPGTLGAEGVVPERGEEAGPASAEAIGHVPGPNEGVYGDPPNSGVGNPDDRSWAYDSSFFFGLTRGLPEATDLDKSGRRWVSSLTIPFDLVTLPTAAIAGLYGRAPEPESESSDDASAASDAPASHEGEAPAGSEAAPETETEATPETETS